MPGRRSEDRLEGICEAALEVFSTKGYRRARMHEIAETAGVAPGTLYLYVEGKEALFLLLVEWLSLRESLPSELPVPTPQPGETVRVLRKGLAQSMQRPVFDDALARRRAPDIADELGRIVDELYQLIHDNRRLLALVERCAADWPELYEVYFVRDRRAFLRRIVDYMELRLAAGQLQPVVDVTVAARVLSETIGWFAWKRMGDIDARGLDEEAVRATLRELLVRAFASTRGRTGRSGPRPR